MLSKLEIHYLFLVKVRAQLETALANELFFFDCWTLLSNLPEYMARAGNRFGQISIYFCCSSVAFADILFSLPNKAYPPCSSSFIKPLQISPWKNTPARVMGIPLESTSASTCDAITNTGSSAANKMSKANRHCNLRKSSVSTGVTDFMINYIKYSSCRSIIRNLEVYPESQV